MHFFLFYVNFIILYSKSGIASKKYHLKLTICLKYKISCKLNNFIWDKKNRISMHDRNNKKNKS